MVEVLSLSLLEDLDSLVYESQIDADAFGCCCYRYCLEGGVDEIMRIIFKKHI